MKPFICSGNVNDPVQGLHRQRLEGSVKVPRFCVSLRPSDISLKHLNGRSGYKSCLL